MVLQLLEWYASTTLQVLGCDRNSHSVSTFNCMSTLVFNLSVTPCLNCQLLCQDIKEGREPHPRWSLGTSALLKCSVSVLIAGITSFTSINEAAYTETEKHTDEAVGIHDMTEKWHVLNYKVHTCCCSCTQWGASFFFFPWLGCVCVWANSLQIVPPDPSYRYYSWHTGKHRILISFILLLSTLPFVLFYLLSRVARFS